MGSFSLVPFLEKRGKKLYVIDNVVEELEKNAKIPRKMEMAKRGLIVIENLKKKGLVEFVKTNVEGHADFSFAMHLFFVRKSENVCLITHDKGLAKDTLINLKNMDSTIFEHDLECLKIDNGNLKKWDIEELKDKLGVSSTIEYDMMNERHQYKLLISFVIDNSMQMREERLENFKKAFESFADEMAVGDLKKSVEYEVIVNDDLKNSKILKKFSDEKMNINSLIGGRVPLLNNQINLALDNLENREKELDKIGIKRYKSWCVILSDGQSFDDTESASERLKNKSDKKEIVVFSFNLSENDLSDKLKPLAKRKKFIKVGANKFSCLSQWLIKLIESRLGTPIDKDVKIEKDSFDGWAIYK